MLIEEIGKSFNESTRSVPRELFLSFGDIPGDAAHFLGALIAAKELRPNTVRHDIRGSRTEKAAGYARVAEWLPQ